MSSKELVAVWGMSSVALAFGAAFACVVAMIWNFDTGFKIGGTVVAFALFSLFAALFVQSAIDRQAANPPTPSTEEETR